MHNGEGFRIWLSEFETRFLLQIAFLPRSSISSISSVLVHDSSRFWAIIGRFSSVLHVFWCHVLYLVLISLYILHAALLFAQRCRFQPIGWRLESYCLVGAYSEITPVWCWCRPSIATVIYCWRLHSISHVKNLCASACDNAAQPGVCRAHQLRGAWQSIDWFV